MESENSYLFKKKEEVSDELLKWQSYQKSPSKIRKSTNDFFVYLAKRKKIKANISKLVEKYSEESNEVDDKIKEFNESSATRRERVI